MSYNIESATEQEKHNAKKSLKILFNNTSWEPRCPNKAFSQPTHDRDCWNFAIKRNKSMSDSKFVGYKEIPFLILSGWYL